MSQKWKKWNESFKKRVDWRRVATELLGLDLGSGTPSNGWVSCRHWDGSDDSPSCSFNIDSGYFKDFRHGERAISAFDALILKGECKHFGEARALLTGMFGLEAPELDKDDPEYNVKWKPWDDRLAEQYCNVKKGITVAGLKRAAARLCMRHGVMCIALPVSDYAGDIVGWMFLRQNGEPFEQKGGNRPKAICKVRDKTNGAFVCDPAVMRELAEFDQEDRETVYWCEGAPDMLAGLSHKFDNEFWFITNCHGTNENIQWMGPADVVLISDADVPGLAGAFKRAKEGDKVYCPPTPHGLKISKDHGYDYRDFLASYSSPLAHPLGGMVEQKDSEKVEKENAEQSAKDHERGRATAYTRARELVESTGCHIISVDGADKMTIYSETTHQTKRITAIDKVSYEQMIQLLGYDFTSKVLATAKDVQTRASVGDTGYSSFSDFKRALALMATSSEYLDLEEVGVGIWAIEDEDRERTGDLLICKHGGAWKYTSDGKFIQQRRPVFGRQIADLSIKTNWFNETQLMEMIAQAKNEEWRVSVYNELYGLVSQWNWENKHMAQTAIGLMFATYIQTLLEWRPIVALTGESNSGKTVFMKLMNKLYLGLAQFSAQSTTAGVLQNMGISSRPLLLDEFDSGSEQQKLLRHFRVGSRGQEMLKGTAHQDGKSYKIQHIPWISGIHAGSRSQADVNRMIPLRIKQAKNNAYTLDLPGSRELRDLGHKILAGVIVTADRALSLAQELTKSDGGKIQSRYRESYSIPYASLGAFMGFDSDAINGIMTDYLNLQVTSDVVLEDAGSDQEALLLDILGSEVRLPKDSPMDTASIAEVLFDPELAAFRNSARNKGVGYVVSRTGNHKKVCFAGRRLTGKHGLLRSTDWEETAGILQILARLPGELLPVKEKQCVGGTTTAVVSVDYRALKKWNDEHGKELK